MHRVKSTENSPWGDIHNVQNKVSDRGLHATLEKKFTLMSAPVGLLQS